MQTIVRALSFPLLGAALSLQAVPARADVVEERMLTESVAVDGGAIEVVVANVLGSIRVTVHDRNVVEMTATETVRARSPSDVERIRDKAGLTTEREDGRVAFVAGSLDDDDCSCGRGGRWPWRNRWNGVARYDIELRVPRGAALDLSTVNDGDVVVEGVQGRFDVSNVNGAVRLSGLGGVGHASTVNGRLTAEFARAPAEPVAFESVNGEIDVTFPSDLAADLAFETLHGDLWTDFETTPVPARPAGAPGSSHFVFRHGQTTIRVGAGGPTHTFETVNGDIVVRASR